MPSSNDMPSSNTIPPSNDISSSTTHHEAVHSDTHIVTPSRATPLDPNIGETTFDYTGMSPIVTNDNNVSSDEFQLTPPPVPLRSPPRSDSETVSCALIINNNNYYYNSISGAINSKTSSIS